jgi:lipopolysaccharide exporter
VIQRPEPRERELVSLYWLNIGAGLAIYAVLLLLSPLVAALYGTAELRAMLPYTGLLFVLNPLGDLYRAVLEKSLRFKELAGVELAASLVGMGLSVWLAVAGFGVWALIWGILATSALRSVGFFAYGRGTFRPRLHFSTSDLQGYLRFGLNNVGAMSLNYINSRLDQLLIGVLLGPIALGYYSMAYNLIMRPVERINPILTRVAFPVLSRVQSDNELVRRGYFTMLTILTSINAPLLIGAAAVAPVAVPLLLGPGWLPIVPLVQILALYALVRSAANAGGSMVLAKGRADAAFYWNVLLFAFIPGSVFLAARFGTVLTVAWTLLGIQLFLFFLWYLLVVRTLLGRCFRPYLESVATPTLIALGMGGGLVALTVLARLPATPATLAIQIGFGALVYIGLYYLLDRKTVQEQIRLLVDRA